MAEALIGLGGNVGDVRATLDEAIARLGDQGPFNPVHLQRLKKRKLALKDLIARLESQLLPDIIA